VPIRFLNTKGCNSLEASLTLSSWLRISLSFYPIAYLAYLDQIQMKNKIHVDPFPVNYKKKIFQIYT